MAKAFYYEGLTIEIDEFLPGLKIEGRVVKIDQDGRNFLHRENPAISEPTLKQLAITLIDKSMGLKERRKEVKQQHVNILKLGPHRWNEWRKENPEIRPLLYEEDLAAIRKEWSSEEEPIDFSNANLIEAKLHCTELVCGNFHEANLGGADLSHANLSRANFCTSDLYETILTGANLDGANFQGTQLAMTRLEGATLTNCTIYGSSAWDLKMDEKTTQKNFNIIYKKELSEGKWVEDHIIVDNLQMAQFIYLLLHNENIRSVIDTITSKAVLILGRFTPKHKEVLDLIREELRRRDYVPILFDFENTKNQSLLETVMTLAGMARFVIADVTDATMVREELASIVKNYPAKPIQPILLYGEREYVSLPEMRQGYKSILETFVYQNKEDVVFKLSIGIIRSAEIWLEARTNKISNGGKTQREIELENEVVALRKQLQEKFI